MRRLIPIVAALGLAACSTAQQSIERAGDAIERKVGN